MAAHAMSGRRWVKVVSAPLSAVLSCAFLGPLILPAAHCPSFTVSTAMLLLLLLLLLHL
jgi:hypothetical protein